MLPTINLSDRNDAHYANIEDENRRLHVASRKEDPLFQQSPELLPPIESVENTVYQPCTYCNYDPKSDTSGSKPPKPQDERKQQPAISNVIPQDITVNTIQQQPVLPSIIPQETNTPTYSAEPRFVPLPAIPAVENTIQQQQPVGPSIIPQDTNTPIYSADPRFEPVPAIPAVENTIQQQQPVLTNIIPQETSTPTYSSEPRLAPLPSITAFENTIQQQQPPVWPNIISKETNTPQYSAEPRLETIPSITSIGNTIHHQSIIPNAISQDINPSQHSGNTPADTTLLLPSSQNGRPHYQARNFYSNNAIPYPFFRYPMWGVNPYFNNYYGFNFYG